VDAVIHEEAELDLDYGHEDIVSDLGPKGMFCSQLLDLYSLCQKHYWSKLLLSQLLIQQIN
jgi:hypothetical protein